MFYSIIIKIFKCYYNLYLFIYKYDLKIVLLYYLSCWYSICILVILLLLWIWIIFSYCKRKSKMVIEIHYENYDIRKKLNGNYYFFIRKYTNYYVLMFIIIKFMTNYYIKFELFTLILRDSKNSASLCFFTWASKNSAQN